MRKLTRVPCLWTKLEDCSTQLSKVVEAITENERAIIY